MDASIEHGRWHHNVTPATQQHILEDSVEIRSQYST
jgi:hypothetical protein